MCVCATCHKNQEEQEEKGRTWCETGQIELLQWLEIHCYVNFNYRQPARNQ